MNSLNLEQKILQIIATFEALPPRQSIDDLKNKISGCRNDLERAAACIGAGAILTCRLEELLREEHGIARAAPRQNSIFQYEKSKEPGLPQTAAYTIVDLWGRMESAKGVLTDVARSRDGAPADAGSHDAEARLSVVWSLLADIAATLCTGFLAQGCAADVAPLVDTLARECKSGAQKMRSFEAGDLKGLL